jgi:hypothetical protein
MQTVEEKRTQGTVSGTIEETRVVKVCRLLIRQAADEPLETL